jgi:hypothetical protein
MRLTFAILLALGLCACGGAPADPAAPADSVAGAGEAEAAGTTDAAATDPSMPAGNELNEAIQAPIDRAQGVEEQVLEGAEQQRQDIEEASQ